ncbi:MAG: hypothetical protein HYV34_03360 [Candidatus Kerfeldbacteria bacterium]|nr:hypothetical protein [Candidatus Kerfeldbacteria bacterium]
MNQSSTLLNKLNSLERELQKLKVSFYLSLPKKQRSTSAYAERALLESAKSVREKIWKSKYAKKIARLS